MRKLSLFSFAMLCTFGVSAKSVLVRSADVLDIQGDNPKAYVEGERVFFDDMSKIKAMGEDYIKAAKPAGDEVLVYKTSMVLDKKQALKKGKKTATAQKDDKGNLKPFEVKMQVYYPNSQKPEAPLPCVILFSGGGWNIAHPTQFALTSRVLADLGLVAVYTNYRTKSTTNKDDPTQCVADAKSAVRYVREHAQELGVKPDMIAVCGVSAGGHIATAAACVDGFDDPSDNLEISCVPNLLMLYSPVIDNSEKGYGYNRIKHLFPAISPSQNLKDNMPPTITFVGTKDILCKPFMCEDYDKFLESKGIDSELYIYEGQGHSATNHYVGKKYYIDSLEKTVAFLQKHKYLK